MSENKIAMVKDFAALMAWQVGSYVIPLLTFPYLTRILGAAQFGAVGFGAALIVYCTIFTDWGFNISATQKIAAERDDPARVNFLFWNTLFAKVALAIISLIIVILGVFLFSPAGLASIILFSWLGVLGNVLTLTWLLQPMGKIKQFAIVAIIGKFSILPATLIFVHTPDDAWKAAAIQSGGSILTGALTFLVAWRSRLFGRCVAKFSDIRYQITEGWDVFLSTASVSLLSGSSAVILGLLSGTTATGIYTAADKIKTAMNSPAAQINSVVYPRVAYLWDRNLASGLRIFCASLVGTLLMGVAAIIFVAIFGDFVVVRILGSGFHDSETVLNILVYSALFGNVAYLIGLQILMPCGARKLRSNAMLVGGVINIVLGAALSFKFGAVGAAIALLIAEIFILSVFALYLVRNGWAKRIVTLSR